MGKLSSSDPHVKSFNAISALTVWAVADGSQPVTLVAHDAAGGEWQFLNTADGRKPHAEEAALIAISELLEMDPSLAELADLPPGWAATRTGVGQPWVRTQTHTGFLAWVRSFLKPSTVLKPAAVLKPVAAIPATEAERALTAVGNAMTSPTVTTIASSVQHV